MDRQIRVSKRLLAAVAALLLFGVAFGVPASRERIAAAIDPRVVATAPEVGVQRDQTERAIGRAHKKMLEQLKTIRGLRLPISDREADAIVERAAADLQTIRRDALTALAEATGAPAGEVPRYVQATEAKLDALADDQTPVLLAPRLYSIVLRTNQAMQQVADKATDDMTKTPTAPPATPTPARTPSPGPRTPSPSPSR